MPVTPSTFRSLTAACLVSSLVALAPGAAASAGNGSPVLVSGGTTGEVYDVPVAFDAVRGTTVFFHTAASLVPGDADGQEDVYESDGGQTTLVSTGTTGGNGATDAYYVGASADGSIVWFDTVESLVPSDTDGSPDV